MKKYIEIEEKKNEFLLNNPQKFVKELTNETDDEIRIIALKNFDILGTDKKDYDLKIHLCYHDEGRECEYIEFFA